MLQRKITKPVKAVKPKAKPRPIWGTKGKDATYAAPAKTAPKNYKPTVTP